MRGRHTNNAMRLLPESRRAITDFIFSKKRNWVTLQKSAKSKKKYFDSNESMRKMCRDFVTENPNFKSTCSPLRNKGPAFRNIFHQDLSDLFSFRKARVDTCQFCGETINKINILSQSQGDTRGRTKRSPFRALQGKWSKVCFAEIWHEFSI